MHRIITGIIAVSLVSAPAFAQQKPSAAMSKAAGIEKQIVDILNKKDAAGMAAHFTNDAVFVGPDGKAITGHGDIEAMYADTFKAWGDFKYSAEVKAAHAIGNGYWILTEATVDGKGLLVQSSSGRTS